MSADKKKANPKKIDQNKVNTSESSNIRPSKEHGGREGPDPTRFGDWEKGGRCIDF